MIANKLPYIRHTLARLSIIYRATFISRNILIVIVIVYLIFFYLSYLIFTFDVQERHREKNFFSYAHPDTFPRFTQIIFFPPCNRLKVLARRGEGLKSDSKSHSPLGNKCRQMREDLIKRKWIFSYLSYTSVRYSIIVSFSFFLNKFSYLHLHRLSLFHSTGSWTKSSPFSREKYNSAPSLMTKKYYFLNARSILYQ